MKNITKLGIQTDELKPEAKKDLNELFDQTLWILKNISENMIRNNISGTSVSDHAIICALVLKYYEDKLLTGDLTVNLTVDEITEAIDSLNDEDSEDEVLQ